MTNLDKLREQLGFEIGENMNKEIIYRKLSDLTKLHHNPRTIKKTAMERLKTSLKSNPDYFEARPIILSDRTGELVIIAGNQRYEAAKSIGMDEVPTFLLSGLTEKQLKKVMSDYHVQRMIDKRGEDFFKIIGKIGGDKLKEKRGSDYFAKIGAKGGSKSKVDGTWKGFAVTGQPANKTKMLPKDKRPCLIRMIDELSEE